MLALRQPCTGCRVAILVNGNEFAIWPEYGEVRNGMQLVLPGHRRIPIDPPYAGTVDVDDNKRDVIARCVELSQARLESAARPKKSL